MSSCVLEEKLSALRFSKDLPLLGFLCRKKGDDVLDIELEFRRVLTDFNVGGRVDLVSSLVVSNIVFFLDMPSAHTNSWTTPVSAMPLVNLMAKQYFHVFVPTGRKAVSTTILQRPTITGISVPKESG